MSLVIGLVTEGPNDRAVISAVSERYVENISSGQRIIYRQIQPPPDRTSGGGEQGGWTEVYKWCLRYPPDIREAFVFGRSLTGQKNCDVLVVHLDGDNLEDYQIHGAPLPARPWSGNIRASYVESLLVSWLWPTPPPNPADSRYILLVPVWATETWLAAALDENWNNPEDENPVPKLISLCPDLDNTSRPGRLRRTRRSAKYQKLAEALADTLASVRRRCAQLDKYLSRLEQIVTP